jgi:hypothetical protein
MSPESQSAIVGGLADGVVGAVLGFILALLLFRLAQKRKLVEYSVTAISLMRLKPSIENVHGIGIQTKLAKRLKIDLYYGISMATVFMALGLSTLDGLFHHVLLFMNDPLGWISLMLVICGIAIYTFMRASLDVYDKRHEFSQDWDWELPVVLNDQN